ncbi:MAG: DUF2577 domain-containing protein [Oscillospiraceae bacterium]|jgi:hypothetical protein|nr:DUF2577 domain-containing protein [Oscillospiraceae bacterium]
MPNLLSLIKQAAVEAVDEAAPCAAVFGRIESASPLRVKVDDRFTLEENQLTRTRAAARFAASGSEVLLLRVQGGAKYIVVDTVL